MTLSGTATATLPPPLLPLSRYEGQEQEEQENEAGGGKRSKRSKRQREGGRASRRRQKEQEEREQAGQEEEAGRARTCIAYYFALHPNTPQRVPPNLHNSTPQSSTHNGCIAQTFSQVGYRTGVRCVNVHGSARRYASTQPEPPPHLDRGRKCGVL